MVNKTKNKWKWYYTFWVIVGYASLIMLVILIGEFFIWSLKWGGVI